MKSDQSNEASKHERLQKVLAAIGVASRREIERWIEAGRITVNNEVATLGVRVDPACDQVRIDGHLRKLNHSFKRQVLAYNKPEGEVCTHSDPEGRPSVFSKLPKPDTGRWISIGRLDINTSGLLLFTNDGELARRLMHPSFQIDREYAVRIFGKVESEQLEALKSGIMLDDGEAKFTDIVASNGEGMNRWFYVCLQEGRNREVRRLWESQGLTVSRLKRVRYGSAIIPDHLRQGKFKQLTEEDIDALADSVGLEPSKKVKKIMINNDRKMSNKKRGQTTKKHKNNARRVSTKKTKR